MNKFQKPIVVAILLLIFTTLFIHNVKSDFPLIFQKDLLAHDESSNSVVAANITRKFFPPMVRINPLNESQGNWMEGPFWQHIPPLFAYVPYLFFKLDGQVTIEVKRLSYAFITLLTGLLFIFAVYKNKKSILATIAATLAAVFWISTPFTRELITGYTFGVSDIILAFTVICAFAGVIWYLRELGEARKNYPWWKLALIALLVALPIMAKNLLGAIPAATFFGLLIWDYRLQLKKPWPTVLAFLGILAVYYGAQYVSSPSTFEKEIIVPIFHIASGYEGWGRPWYWYLTNYLPQRYLFGWTWIYYTGLILAIIYNLKFLILKQGERKVRITLAVSLIWFIWNLLVISVVRSKIPNFIYQSYLLSLYVIVYSFVIFVKSVATKQSESWVRFFASIGMVIPAILVCSILVTGYETFQFTQQFKIQRDIVYNYSSEHEKFYQTAEELRLMGLTTKDLVIIRVSDNDCWFRYYPLFLTGTESKTLLEMSFGFDANAIKQKYDRMFFVVNKIDSASFDARRFELKNYSAIEFELNQMDNLQIRQALNNFLAEHYADIQADILRIKKDKTTCQWLVPDEILNAP